MKLKITAIIKILIYETYNPITHTNCIENLYEHLGMSSKGRRIEHIWEQQDCQFKTAYNILNYLQYEIGIFDNDNFIPFDSTSSALDVLCEKLYSAHMTKTDLAKKLDISYRGLMHSLRTSDSKIGTLTKMFNVVGSDILVRNKNNPSNCYILGNGDYFDYLLNKEYREALSQLPTSI